MIHISIYPNKTTHPSHQIMPRMFYLIINIPHGIITNKPHGLHEREPRARQQQSTALGGGEDFTHL